MVYAVLVAPVVGAAVFTHCFQYYFLVGFAQGHGQEHAVLLRDLKRFPQPIVSLRSLLSDHLKRVDPTEMFSIMSY